MSRRTKKSVITIILSSLITFATIQYITKPNSYAVSINDKIIGYVSKEEASKWEYVDSEEAILIEDAVQVVSLTPVNVDKSYIASSETIKSSIGQYMNTSTAAIELKYDGMVIGRILKESDLEYILSKVTQYYKNNSKLQSAKVLETVNNLDKNITTTTYGNIDSNDDIVRHIISQNNISEKPLVEVHLLDVQGAEEKIPYNTEVKWDNSLSIGESKVESQGVDGISKVEKELKIVNNKIIDKRNISSQIVSEPEKEVIVKGTLLNASTVSLNIPSRGTFTSGFGPRWGAFHKGIDIGAPIGNPIYAAMDGVVEFSGDQGTYGYVVKIKHGQNVMTVYAHCSELLVKAGDSVSKGQEIAKVGNTGQSTGPHLHFEVRVNGNPVDPSTFTYN